MKQAIHGLGFLLCLALLIGFSASPVLAAAIDSTKQGGITIEIRNPDTNDLYPEAAAVELYQIARFALDEGTPRYIATRDYSGLGIEFTSLTAAKEQQAIHRLLALIDEKELVPLRTVKSETGAFRAEGLELGLYLARYVSEGKKLNISSFLVTMPIRKIRTASWVYDVTVYPKYTELRMETVVPPLEEEEGPMLGTVLSDGVPTWQGMTLPQTGTLRWPVLLLSILGFVLFALGWADLFLKKE